MLDLFGIRHRGLQSLLSAYVDDQVTDAEARRVQRHLSGCEACGAELESLRATVGLLRSLPELAVPRSFRLTAIPESRPVRAAPVYSRPLMAAASVAAALLIALVAVDLSDLGTSVDIPSSATVTDSSGEIAVAAEAAEAPEALEEVAIQRAVEPQIEIEVEAETEAAAEVEIEALREVEQESVVEVESIAAAAPEADDGAAGERATKALARPEEALVAEALEAAPEEALALEAASEPATSEAGGGVDDLAVAGLAGEPELELFAADAAVETAEIEALAAAPEAPAGGDGGIEVAGTGPLAEPDTDDPGGFPYLPLQIAAGAVLGALLLGLLYLRRRRI